MARALDALLAMDLNTYFLKLAQQGAKLPPYFNVDTLREQAWINDMTT